MELLFNLWPNAKKRCITLSYDDGTIDDRRLVEIMNKHGIRGTFHLNTAFFDDGKHVCSAEIASLYNGHEISAHTHTHPYMCDMPANICVNEVLENRLLLEKYSPEIVRSMSYPYGRFNSSIINTLRDCGIEYSRTTINNPFFTLPEDFMCWNPNCHHNDVAKTFESFCKVTSPKRLLLFYAWGHSYEFERDGNWQLIEKFCADAGGNSDVWYATGIEIKDYADAVRSLKVSADGKKFSNRSITDVWVTADGESVCIAAGKTVEF